MKKIIMLCCFLLCFLAVKAPLSAQIICEENFDYAVQDTFSSLGGWEAYATSGTLKPAIVEGSLSYKGYKNSGIGNKVRLNTKGYDLRRYFPDVDTSKILYCGALIKVDSAQLDGDYFFGLIGTTSNPTAGRVLARDTAGQFMFGYTKASSSSFIYWDTNNLYDYGTTHLIVIKYEHLAPDTSVEPYYGNDICSFFVNPPIQYNEPEPYYVVGGNDSMSIDYPTRGIFIRQGSETKAPVVEIDGISFGYTWHDVIGSYGGFELADETHLLMQHYGASNGGGFADFNNDGLMDVLLLTNGNAPHKLLMGTDDGAFRLNVASQIARDSLPGAACAFADYDNDGLIDVYISNVSGKNYLYKNVGNAFLELDTTSVICQDDAQTSTPSWADFNNDGYLDLFVANVNGPNFLYINNGDGTFVKDVTSDVVQDNVASYHGAWADFNNDGWIDLAVANYMTGGNFHAVSLFVNNEGVLTKVTDPSVGSIITDNESAYTTLSWGDYNNDGHLDLFVGAVVNSLASKSTSRLYKNNGNGTFTEVTNTPLTTFEANVYGAGWLDYDNDGNLDLYVAVNASSAAKSQNFLFKGDGNGGFVSIEVDGSVNTPQRSPGLVIGDLNGDGFPDMLTGITPTSRTTQYYVNTGNDNNWIGLKLNTTKGNVYGLGAKVICKFGDKTITRYVTQNNGIYCSNSTEIILGLGQEVDCEITIEWPSGYIQNYGNPIINQYYTVSEPLLFDIYDLLSEISTTPSRHYAHGFADVNNDGHMDIVILPFSIDSPNALYINNGDGTFTNDTNSVIVKDRNYSIGCAFGDYNNDGWIDLFVSNKEPMGADYSQLYKNNNGVFERDFETAVCKRSFPGVSASWADYNNDGFLDLLICTFGEKNLLYKNDGQGDFILDSTSDVMQGSIATYDAVWADFDNNGYQDLFIINNYYESLPCDVNELYMNYDGVLVRETDPAVGEIISFNSAFPQTVSAGDYNNDGYIDIFVGSHVFSAITYKKSRLYQNNGDGTFTTIDNTPVTAYEKSITGSTWLDYDNDGNLDLLLTVNSGSRPTSQNFIFKGDGNGGFEEVGNNIFVDNQERSMGLSMGDINNDGFVDVYAGNYPDSRRGALYVNLGNENSWIGVMLEGVGSNKQGVGARVICYADGRVQHRNVNAHNGIYTSNTPYQVFGLGSATAYDSIVVKWPSGSVQVVKGLGLNQYHLITEPIESGTKEIISANDYAFNVYPNPASADITLKIEQENLNQEKVQIRIVNMAGQVVYTYSEVGMTEKTLNVNSFKPGMYFIEITIGTERDVQKLVVK